jgi:hypothetical protein
MKKQLVLALALAAAPFAAFADGHSYTYIEGGFAQLDQELPQDEEFEIDDIEAGGFYLAGSAALSDTFHVFGAYRSGDDDVGVSLPGGPRLGSAGVDLSQYVLGLGYHTSLNARTDFVAELSMLSTEIDVEGDGQPSVEGDDVRVAVGVRHLIADPVEVWIKANYTDGDVYDGAGSVSAGVQYRLTRVWGLVGEIEAGGEFSQYAAGVRASF